MSAEHYYNENDPRSAAWLRGLMERQLIPHGYVDERSIADISPNELKGYTQCHFFAGIGGWPLALRLAGIPETKKLWTGSCPCQPFSAGGLRQGSRDKRHLWPVWFDLIRAREPDIVYGEQVASSEVVGSVGTRHDESAPPVWFDGVCADLESAHYTPTAIDLPAACVGSPHNRSRLWWMAYSDRRRCEQRDEGQRTVSIADKGSASCGLGNTKGGRRGECGNAAFPHNSGHLERPGWSGFATTLCRDGETRRFEPGSFPLAHGLPGRVGLLRGYGNAIVSELAAQFILACEEIMRELE